MAKRTRFYFWDGIISTGFLNITSK